MLILTFICSILTGGFLTYHLGAPLELAAGIFFGFWTVIFLVIFFLEYLSEAIEGIVKKI